MPTARRRTTSVGPGISSPVPSNWKEANDCHHAALPSAIYLLIDV